MIKLVKDGEIESAPEIIETLKGGISDAEANKLFSIALLKIYNDPEAEPELTICGSDSLVTCSTAEEVARMCKLQILGLSVTTVAFKEGTMAGDTQITAETTIYRAQKIYKTPDGSLVGGCGAWSKAYQALDWMLNGEKGDSPKFDGAQILIARPDGSLWIADDEFPAYPLLDKFIAVGCGAQAAMLAMSDGSSAVEAIQKVSKLDAHTSSPVQYLSLKKTTTRKQRVK